MATNSIYLDIKILIFLICLDVKINAIKIDAMDHVDQIIEQWRRERSDLDLESIGPIGRIKRLAHHLEGEMDAAFTKHGLNLAGFDVLATLRRSGKPYRLSAGALMASTMVTSGTMTHRIDQLVEAGYAKRIRNPDDGRSVLISLTSKGLKVIDAAVTTHAKTVSRLTSGLSESEFRRLNRLLATFLATLEDTDEG